ncbi:LysR family transcriptional regulator [Fodinicola feengrottensis]|uniref:LysR family transcriptional regulator n=1 Tax=Fodinicola feengrottensis TaxID=435914 RepID=UPI002442EAB2|nr:LysR family transcriptional regulator [Fodinicola feengrottensis]
MPEPPAVLPFAPGADAVDLKHLRAFVAVADNLNFARAAERLRTCRRPRSAGRSGRWSGWWGCQLFHRSTHRVELTLAGEALLDSARTVLAELDRGLKATRAVGGELDARMVTLLDPIVAAGRDAGDLCAVRAANERMHAQFPLSSDVEVLPVSAGGVPGLRLTPALPAGTTELLFLHGGGFVLGSAFGYRALVAALIAETGTTAVIPDYPACAGASLPGRTG